MSVIYSEDILVCIGKWLLKKGDCVDLFAMSQVSKLERSFQSTLQVC